MLRLCTLHRFPFWSRRAWLLAMVLTAGCAHERADVRDALVRRIAPEEATGAKPDPQEGAAAGKATTDALVRRTKAPQAEVERAAPAPGDAGKTDLPAPIEGAAPMTNLVRPAAPPGPSPAESPEAAELDAITASGRPISLPEAIGLAFRLQPRLRAQLESIAQARGREEIVFSTFLPTAAGTTASAGSTWASAASRSVSAATRRPGSTSSRPSGPCRSA